MSTGRAALIRARLKRQADAAGQDFQLVLTRFGLERVLYRLSISEYASQFLLKGALAFSLWFDHPHRPTRDVDLLGFGSGDADRIMRLFKEICSIAVDDGLEFDPASIRVQGIREEARYGGTRVTVNATLDGAKLKLQVDIGFGDAVTPAAVEQIYPVLLEELPAPKLKIYPRETVCAEKLEAIVTLGMANSRMKDYFDLLALSREGMIAATTLEAALAQTFHRRQTAIPDELPIGLTEDFAEDIQKQRQWMGFLDRNRLQAPHLVDVVKELRVYFAPRLKAARTQLSLGPVGQGSREQSINSP